MPVLFRENGIRLLFPDDWQLTREESPTGWTLFLQSPETSFFLLTFDGDMPEVGLVATTALEALRVDYPELEAEEVVESLAGQPAQGHQIRFFSLDLTNSCATRCFYSDSGTIFVMWQANDLELETMEPILQAICASIHLEEE